MNVTTKALLCLYVGFNAFGSINGRLGKETSSISTKKETNTAMREFPSIFTNNVKTDTKQYNRFLNVEDDHILIPNTYCEYYKFGGDGSCEDGLPFDEVWKMCLDDQDQECMGVMWNSCEGDTNDISVNGAWKLMLPGQIIGDENIPTDTCGGKEQALGHWSVFVRSDKYSEECLEVNEGFNMKPEGSFNSSKGTYISAQTTPFMTDNIKICDIDINYNCSSNGATSAPTCDWMVNLEYSRNKYGECNPTNSSYRRGIFAASGTGPDPYQVSEISTPDKRNFSQIRGEMDSIFNSTNFFLNKVQLKICNRRPVRSGILPSGEKLLPDDQVFSQDEKYRLQYELNGNLVLYNEFEPILSSNTEETNVGFAQMQTDGNFVVRDANETVVFETDTSGNSKTFLQVTNEGEMVLNRRLFKFTKTSRSPSASPSNVLSNKPTQQQESIAQIDFSNPNSQGNTYFELKGGAEIKTAPGGSFSALRIDSDGPYALVPGINISPSQMTDCTLMIGLYLESIANNHGWVFGNEQSGYDRTILMHDIRFSHAISSAVGQPWTAWSNPQSPPLHQWIHVTAVFRQGGESYVFLNGNRSDKTVIANNDEGKGDLWIGRPHHGGHWTDSWIKEVRVFDHAVSDEDVESYAEAFLASTVV